MGCLACLPCCCGGGTDEPDEDIGQSYTLTRGRPAATITQDTRGSRRQFAPTVDGESPRFSTSNIATAIVTGGTHVRTRSEPAPIRTKIQNQVCPSVDEYNESLVFGPCHPAFKLSPERGLGHFIL